VATQKTAGVLGDDLALNAQQVAGVRAERELPVVWAVARGSLVNKGILVPAALALSGVAPGLVTPLLMLGGAFLCLEGAEKLAHRWLHARADAAAGRAALSQALAEPATDLALFERDKIKGAIRTDFILSAEIIVITLGTVAGQPLATQLAVLVAIALLMTAGVYGLVAAIVKLDDLGLALLRRGGAMAPAGRAIVRAAPWLMKLLTVLGTAAMFVVGGGILAHGIAPLHLAVESLGAAAGAPWQGVVGLLANALIGVAAGAMALAVVRLGQRTWRRLRGAAVAA
jgi:predicted DNA repair protein MutK